MVPILRGDGGGKGEGEGGGTLHRGVTDDPRLSPAHHTARPKIITQSLLTKGTNAWHYGYVLQMKDRGIKVVSCFNEGEVEKMTFDAKGYMTNWQGFREMNTRTWEQRQSDAKRLDALRLMEHRGIMLTQSQITEMETLVLKSLDATN